MKSLIRHKHEKYHIFGGYYLCLEGDETNILVVSVG